MNICNKKLRLEGRIKIKLFLLPSDEKVTKLLLNLNIIIYPVQKLLKSQ